MAGPEAQAAAPENAGLPRRFGKYELLEKIGSGGMAEIFKARLTGIEGFEKLLVVKKILPGFASNRSFVKMLIDEAKISSVLHHPNVVQIYDLGQVDDQYFIAMEYVHGKDLLKILSRCVKLKKRIPLKLTLYIISEVCKGLAYAHAALDLRGQPLHIIHRDVSPSNIILSYDGDVKIMDFGVARARNQQQETRSGVLKGKLGYMSPEQVTAKPLDFRSDIFSLGTILYEALTLKRLFLGKTDLETLINIRDVRIERRLQKHSYIPDPVAEAIRTACARHPEERYPTAMEMHEALQDFMFDKGLRGRPRDLGEFIQHLFDEDSSVRVGVTSDRVDVELAEAAHVEVPVGADSDAALDVAVAADEEEVGSFDAASESVSPPREEDADAEARHSRLTGELRDSVLRGDSARAAAEEERRARDAAERRAREEAERRRAELAVAEQRAVEEEERRRAESAAAARRAREDAAARAARIAAGTDRPLASSGDTAWRRTTTTSRMRAVQAGGGTQPGVSSRGSASSTWDMPGWPETSSVSATDDDAEARFDSVGSYSRPGFDPMRARSQTGAERRTPTGVDGPTFEVAESSEVSAEIPHDITARLGRSTFRLRDNLGNVFGPVAFANFLNLIRGRAVTEHEMVSVDGGEWRPARSTPGIREVQQALFRPEINRPVMNGDVDHLAIPRMLYKLWAGRVTGKLKFSYKTTRKEIYFLGGKPQHVASSLKGELLGSYLVARKIVAPEQLQTAIQRMTGTREKLGDALVNLGYLRHHQLFDAFQQLHRRKFLQIFVWNTGTFEMYERQRPPRGVILLDLDLPSMISEGVREFYGFEELKNWFKPHYSKHVKEVSGSRGRVRIQDLRFNSIEMRFLNYVQQGGSVVQLLRSYARVNRDALTLFRVLFLLIQMDVYRLDD